MAYANPSPSYGRYGDTVLAHISPLEALILKHLGGAGTRNPRDQRLEFYNVAGGGIGAGEREGYGAGSGGFAGGGATGSAGGGGGIGTSGSPAPNPREVLAGWSPRIDQSAITNSQGKAPTSESPSLGSQIVDWLGRQLNPATPPKKATFSPTGPFPTSLPSGIIQAGAPLPGIGTAINQFGDWNADNLERALHQSGVVDTPTARSTGPLAKDWGMGGVMDPETSIGIGGAMDKMPNNPGGIRGSVDPGAFSRAGGQGGMGGIGGGARSPGTSPGVPQIPGAPPIQVPRPPMWQAPDALPPPAFLGNTTGMTPLQIRSMIATMGTQGVGGEFRSSEALDYYKNLLANSFISKGQLGDFSTLLPVENQYLQNTWGLSYDPNTASMLEALGITPNKKGKK